jgi:ADP-ribose pyrophosphatase
MPYHPVDKQVLFSGKKVRLELHTMEDDDGKRRVSEIVVHPGAVVILPFLKPDQILLIRNRRHAVGQILLELPAGTLEKSEEPINCAGRELVEETGFLAGRLQPLGNFFTSPGVLTEKMFAFAAYDLEMTQTNLDDGEEIETQPVSFNDAIGMIREGQIHDGKTIAVILMYDKFFRK